MKNIIYQNENSEMAVKYLYTVGGYSTYSISIRSNNFSGIYNFCFSIENVNKYILEINKMYDSFDGCVCLEDCESDAYISLIFKDKKNFCVNGQIGGSYESHMLKFEFSADQTLLIGLKENLL